jgi:hypothetical protein
MRRSRRLARNSIIQYEELKTAAGGSGSGGGSGFGTGQVKFFRVRVPPPVEDRAAAGLSKFRLPKLEARTKYRADQVISFIVCMVLLNFLYSHLLPMTRIVVLPLTLYFIWAISKKELGTFVGEREED